MQFTYEITVPVNTTKDDPERLPIKLCYGHLKRVQVFFPWGCAGWVGIRVVHYEYQLYPTNRASWFMGNDLLIDFECEYEILQGWNEFKLEGYNEDNFYPHKPIVAFNVLPMPNVPLNFMPWIEGV